MKKAIVTGATGFIGECLTKKLISNHVETWAVVRDKNKLNAESPYLHVVEASFDEYMQLSQLISERNFDVCFHLAWDGTWGEPFKDYDRQLMNARYACDMAVQAAQMNCRRFIFSSTIVQLEALKYMLSDEGQPRYSCIYGTAKTCAALLCRIIAEQKGMEWNTAVLSSIYGVGDKSKMIENVLIQSFLAGVRPKLVTGDHLYDSTYVEDAVSGLLAIAEYGQSNKTYYVGHRQLKTFRELVCEIRDVLAPDMELKFGEYPGVTSIDYSLIDVDALYRDTGFECQIGIPDGIRRTADWLQRYDDAGLKIRGGGTS